MPRDKLIDPDDGTPLRRGSGIHAPVEQAVEEAIEAFAGNWACIVRRTDAGVHATGGVRTSTSTRYPATDSVRDE